MRTQRFQMLPAVRVGVGALPPLPLMSRGFGATIATTTIVDSTGVDAALQAMVSDIGQNGCQQTNTASVNAFQSAYNTWAANQSATGTTPTGMPTFSTGTNQLSVDGLYGNDTQSAANFINSQDSLNLTIPTGCVSSSSDSGSSSSSTPSTSTSSPSQTVNVSTGNPYVPYLVAGAVVATGVAGYAVWHHEKKVGRRRPMAHRAVHRLTRRRR